MRGWISVGQPFVPSPLVSTLRPRLLLILRRIDLLLALLHLLHDLLG
jgi:hypothetical protein